METDQAQYEAILMRLGTLEKQNRRLRFVGLVALLGILGLGTIAWTTMEIRSYEGQFFLRDQKGNMRGALSYEATQNFGTLWLGDVGENKEEGMFTARPDILLSYNAKTRLPFLSFRDKEGTVRAELGFATDGSTGLWLYDKDGATRANVGFTENTQKPNIWLYDENGKAIWKAIK